MVTVQDVHNVTFEKAMRGYHVEQVDSFLDQVAAQLEQDESQIAALTKSNDELKSKLAELARQLEGYRADEDALKSALLNAQRMGENVIREAKQKADALVREASIRADDIARAAESRISDQQIELQRVKSEVAQFKSNVLSLYKAHIESLSTLPDDEEAAAQPEAEPAAVQPETVPETEPVQPAVQEAAPEFVPEAPAAPAALAAAQTAAPVSSFWEQDEDTLTQAAPQPEPEAPAVSSSPFRGITFSD